MSDIFLDSECKRDVPSFIEPRPPLITNPFMRRRPQKGTNLMDLFEEESIHDDQELVQVYLRLKPCTIPSNLYEVRGDRYLITSLDTTTAGHGRRTQHNVSKMYTFSHIFPEDTTQREIFEHIVKDNLRKLPEGRSFTLLTYGASGSGKTYTLMGTVASPGLVPRSLEYLFNNVEVESHPVYKPVEGGYDTLSYSSQEYELLFVKKLRKLSISLRDKYRRMSCQLKTDLKGSVLDLSSSKRYIWVSFIEIYNEGIYDLLALTDRRSSKLVIREDSNGNVYVKGATQAFVRSGEEAYDVMVAGKHNLQVAATGVHAESSRSHCIFTITMLTENEGTFVTSCVRLCDLAGSERARRTRNTGARMQESRAINTSLHVLERCLHSLRRKQSSSSASSATNRSVVPYRESKLTRLLGAGLSGARGESVTMVVTLNPSPEYAHETRHVLQLAAVAKDLQLNNTIAEYPSSFESSNQDLSSSMYSELVKLRTCNERLNFELLQSHNYNKELTALMDEKQASNADLMREVVDMAKEGSRQFYESQMSALKTEMDEIKEEYEEIIKDLKHQIENPEAYKIDQLIAENATLKEQLTAEKLARARAEEEIQHLRACIDERDEIEDLSKKEHLSESDTEEENDELCNESLEPTFKKHDLNRTRQLRQSLVVLIDEDSDTDTLKDTSNDSVECAFGNVTNTVKRNVSRDLDDLDLVTIKLGNKGCYFFNEDNLIAEKSTHETFCVKRGAGSHDDEAPEVVVKTISHAKRETDTNRTTNDSLTQFEQFELESNTRNPHESLESPEEFGKNLHTNTKSFFYDSITNAEQEQNNYRSPSIIQDHVCDNYGSSMIKKLLKKKFVAPNEVRNNADPYILKQKAEIENEISQVSEHTFEKSYESVDFFESPRTGKDIVHDDKDETKDMIEPLLSENSRVEKSESMQFNNNTVPSLPLDTKNLQEKLESINIDTVPSSPLDKCRDEKCDTNNITVEQHISIINLSHVEDAKETIIESDAIEIKNQSPVTDSSEIEFANQPNVIEESKEPDAFTSLTCDVFKVPLPIIDDTKTDEKIKELPKKSNFDDKTSDDITCGTIDNTLDAFEDIYKNVTLPRVTEFDLLVTDEKPQPEAETKYNLRQKSKKTRINNKDENLPINIKDRECFKEINGEILLESQAKCESKPKRNLRLRRRKDELEQKLKDIDNLQTEFSDVTMNVPASTKVVEDIPSPEKDDEENISPVLGIQSCPSKSITRSRRKLFTPRAEALDEICPQTVDNCEQIRVPRPSYHRPRARRKL